MPECQKVKNGGLDQYDPERLGRLIFVTVRKNVGMKGLIRMLAVKPDKICGHESQTVRVVIFLMAAKSSSPDQQQQQR